MYEQLKAYNYLYNKEERRKVTANAIKALRIDAKLQQKEVADLLRIKETTYQSYENGRAEPPTEILVRLSFLYELPIDIIVQKTNFDKDTEKTKEILTAYDEQIIELEEKLKGANPVLKAQLTPILEKLKKTTQEIKDETNNGSSDNKKP
ncbi:MAG: helix-turn-helix domain-containing protein [Clostridiales bacterium]|nr:helix-turn-helix domain-containing protein [Clostridiales bacterium]